MRTPATVTVRVTASSGSDGAQETCSHDGSKAGQEREVEAKWQCGKVKGDGQHWTTGGEPPLGWKHEVRVKGSREGEAAAHG